MKIWISLLVAVFAVSATLAVDIQECVEGKTVKAINCDECKNDGDCCKKGEETECFMILKENIEGKRTLPIPQYATPNFGLGMTAIYPGNYLAQNALLSMCARETFPYVCQRKRLFDYNFQCPINIPYCQRIPCSPGDDSLDRDFSKCISNPGCCFDQELYMHKALYRDLILPGVPVCHLAIRNKYFQKEAREYVSKYRGWNPLLTSCLIDSYKDYIYMNKRTCEGVKVLEYFGFKAKLAGWTGINRHECLLIGGCWREQFGMCNYEPRVTKLRIRSAQEIPLPKKWTPQQVYGQPKCLDLDYNMTARNFLSSLHYCLASGCSIDPSISTSVIQYYMLNVSANLPSHMANLFRHEFNNGVVGADNYEQQMNYYHQHQHDIQKLHQYSTNYVMYGGGSAPGVPMPHTEYGGFMPILTQANYNSNPYSGGYGRTLSGNVDDDDDDGEISANTYSYGYHSQNAPRHPYNPVPQHFPQPIFGQQTYYQPYRQHFYCPFRNPRIPNLRPLKGRFDGCCERPLCYMNRETVAEQTSGAASYYRPWSAWSACSVSCGEGVKTRRRVCIGVAKCHGKDTETEKCVGYYQCHGGQFLPWGNWSRCSARKCGDRGERYRVRKCSPGYRCTGKYTQNAKCVKTC